MLSDLFSNRMLISGLLAWWLAQFTKPFTEYLVTHTWNWGLWFSSGGMPSSHSALVTATALAIGFYAGFGSPAFALSVAVCMIVIYDAAGVRRQAGLHAQKLNQLITALLSGHPISEQTLKEVIGHTPRQVVAGVVLGIIVAFLVKGIWP